MDHLKNAIQELADFTESPARETLEVAKVHSLIAIGEGLARIADVIWEDLDSDKEQSNIK